MAKLLLIIDYRITSCVEIVKGDRKAIASGKRQPERSDAECDILSCCKQDVIWLIGLHFFELLVTYYTTNW
jgi:hypothetical protein